MSKNLNNIIQYGKIGIGSFLTIGGFTAGWRGVYSRMMKEEAFYNHLEIIDSKTISEAYQGLSDLYEIATVTGVVGVLIIGGGMLISSGVYNLCKNFREECIK